MRGCEGGLGSSLHESNFRKHLYTPSHPLTGVYEQPPCDFCAAAWLPRTRPPAHAGQRTTARLNTSGSRQRKHSRAACSRLRIFGTDMTSTGSSQRRQLETCWGLWHSDTAMSNSNTSRAVVRTQPSKNGSTPRWGVFGNPVAERKLLKVKSKQLQFWR